MKTLTTPKMKKFVKAIAKEYDLEVETIKKKWNCWTVCTKNPDVSEEVLYWYRNPYSMPKTMPSSQYKEYKILKEQKERVRKFWDKVKLFINGGKGFECSDYWFVPNTYVFVY